MKLMPIKPLDELRRWFQTCKISDVLDSYYGYISREQYDKSAVLVYLTTLASSYIVTAYFSDITPETKGADISFVLLRAAFVGIFPAFVSVVRSNPSEK